MNCKVTSIIVTFNATRNNWISKCLDSLTHSTYPTDIIVIDNASTDETVDIIKNKYPEILLIESESNLGFAKANNIGLERALKNSADYFFLLNQDAWIEPTTLETLIDAHLNNTDFGILSPVHLNGSGALLDLLFLQYISSSADDGRALYTDLLKSNNCKQIYRVDFVNAAAWLISKNCVTEVGVFDSILFTHYGEDRNYLQRTIFHKMKIGVVPKAFIYHDREERSGLKTKNVFLDDEKKYRFIVKYSNILMADFKIKAQQEIQQLSKQIWYFRKRFNFKEAKNIRRRQQEYLELLDLIIERRKIY